MASIIEIAARQLGPNKDKPGPTSTVDDTLKAIFEEFESAPDSKAKSAALKSFIEVIRNSD